MNRLPFFPGPEVVHCDSVHLANGRFVINLSSTAPSANCPVCQTASTRVHSHYLRQLIDLPWHGGAVNIHWRSRRFFCNNLACSRRIFTERLPDVALPYGRRTCRLDTALKYIALECGGEPGSRLAARLGIPASGDTLLRMLYGLPLPVRPTPRVLGVDEFALRRGQRYGTLLCDLARHCMVDLLPERSRGSLATWLRQHPGVQIVSRDRADDFIQGADDGAPHAQQVADRFHLLKNLGQAVRRLTDHHHDCLRQAAQMQWEDAQPPVRKRRRSPPKVKKARFLAGNQSAAEQLRVARRERRRQRYERVMELARQGLSQRAIAREIGLNRATVARYVHARRFPERVSSERRTLVTPYIPYLWQRWEDGIHNARQLTDELCAKGFRGSYDGVRRFVHPWRYLAPSGPRTPPMIVPTPRDIVRLIMSKPRRQNTTDDRLLQFLGKASSAMKRNLDLARRFVTIVRTRAVRKLCPWIKATRGRGVFAEVRRFAAGISADLPAVRAAIRLPWSNGPTEGYINRLKMVKRTMYGRASFDLLRRRILCAE